MKYGARLLTAGIMSAASGITTASKAVGRGRGGSFLSSGGRVVGVQTPAEIKRISEERKKR